MAPNNSIKAVLFDLGNTLLDFDALDIERIFKSGADRAYAYLQQKGRPLPSFNNYHARMKRRMFYRFSWSRLIRRDFNSLHTLRHICTNIGQHLTDQELEELAWQWYEPLSNTATAAAEIREVLAWLLGLKLKLGIISNTFIPGAILDRHLAKEGLLEYFPVRIYSCDTKFRKPSRKIFRLALGKLNCQPHQAIFVGDTPRMDIRGARRAGLVAVLKDYKQYHNLRDRWMPYTKPDFTITRMSQLREIIESLLQAS